MTAKTWHYQTKPREWLIPMGGLKVNRCKQCHQLIQQGYYCDKCSTEVIIKALRKAVTEYTTVKKDSLFRDNPIALKVAIPTNFGDNLC